MVIKHKRWLLEYPPERNSTWPRSLPTPPASRHQSLDIRACLSSPKEAPLGDEAPEEARLGCTLHEEPEGSLSASGIGTQAISTLCGTRQAATELTVIGHFIGIYTHVGPQKRQTSALQNKMCWKPLSKVNILLGFFFFFFFFFGILVMTKSKFFWMSIMSWMLLASSVAGLLRGRELSRWCPWGNHLREDGFCKMLGTCRSVWFMWSRGGRTGL